jgi:hypothetical protein
MLKNIVPRVRRRSIVVVSTSETTRGPKATELHRNHGMRAVDSTLPTYLPCSAIPSPPTTIPCTLLHGGGGGVDDNGRHVYRGLVGRSSYQHGASQGGGDGTADPAAVGEKARLRRPVIFRTGVSRRGVVFHGAGGIVSSLWQKK